MTRIRSELCQAPWYGVMRSELDAAVTALALSGHVHHLTVPHSK